MKTLYPLIIAALCNGSYAIEVEEPGIETATFEIRSPDDTVATLGKVDFLIDFQAEHDSLFDLKIRRGGLTLHDGRPITVFGYDKAAGIIVTASAPITNISVSGVQGKDVLALFHNSNNEIVAPHSSDIRLFDLDFNPVEFSYQPATPPQNLNMDVSILIDKSGSMDGHMSSVLTATRNFMAGLPDFTRCHVLTFSTKVERLTSSDASQIASCRNSIWSLNRPIKAEGGTALFSALENAFRTKTQNSMGIPHLVIALTDGVNTQDHGLSKEQLITLKQQENTQLLTFWAGSYDPTHLQGLANLESVSTQDIKTDLDAFFHTIGVSVSGLQTLTIQ